MRRYLWIVLSAAVILTIGILAGMTLYRNAKDNGAADPPTIQTEARREASRTWVEEQTASVVRLEVYDRDGTKIATGSGFAAMEEPVLVTARHVVVNMEYMIATRDDGTTFRVDRILAADEDSDVALCALPGDAGLKPLPVKRDVPARGTKVIAIGSQFGLINLVSEGIVSGTWESDKVKRVVFTAPVSGGSSGGPLLDDAGNVIGIITGTYEKGQNLNLAAYADVIYVLNH